MLINLPKKLKWRILLLLAVVCSPLPGCYTISRIASPWKAITVFADAGANDLIPGAEVSRLRIGAYNIAHGRGSGSNNWAGGDEAERLARLRKIAGFLRDANLDVVVLNEVDFDSSWSFRVNQAEFLACEAGFPFRTEQRNIDVEVPFFSWRFGNAVLSKYPISAAQLVEYPAYSQWEAVLGGKKNGLLCTIDVSPQRQVRVMAVHLSHRSEAVRIQSAQKIQREERRSDTPFIAAGDFNSTPVDFPHAKTDQNGQTALSLLLEENRFATLPTQAPAANEYTFPSTNPARVIDWILVSEPGRLISKEIYPVEFSDHRPVVGVVRFD